MLFFGSSRGVRSNFSEMDLTLGCIGPRHLILIIQATMLTGPFMPQATKFQPHGPATLSLKQFGAVMELRAARAYFYRILTAPDRTYTGRTSSRGPQLRYAHRSVPDLH